MMTNIRTLNVWTLTLALAAAAAPAGAQTMTDALSQAYLTNPTLAAQRASMISHSGVPDKTTRE